MPRIFHQPDPFKLKRVLNEIYCLNFTEKQFNSKCAAQNIKQILSDDHINENFIKQWFNTDAEAAFVNNAEEFCRNILNEALKMANEVLPHKIDNFFGNLDIDKNFDLLRYVVMDCFINIDHIFHLNMPQDKVMFSNVSVFYAELLKEKTNDNQYKYFLDQYRASCNNYWLKNDFDLVEVLDPGALNYQKAHTPVSKELHKILGLLIRNINKNPLHKHFPNTQKTVNSKNYEQKQSVTEKYSRERYNKEAIYSKIKMADLETYFFDCIYGNLIQASDSKFDFIDSDKSTYLNGLYYLDQIYDFKNMVYLAKRLEEFEYTYEGNRFKESDLSEVLYQTILIPDVFSKEYYIDVLLKVLSAEKDADYSYKSCRDSKNVLAFVGPLHRSYKEIQNDNLEKCMEFIMYLSKIYLPVVSACFYVLILNKATSLADLSYILRNVIQTSVEDYYAEYLTSTKPMFDELKGYVKKNLEKIYKLVAEKIYPDESTYKRIAKDFSLSTYPKELRIKLLDEFIKYSIMADRNNLSDPTKKEITYSAINVMDLYMSFESPEEALKRRIRSQKQLTEQQNTIKMKNKELADEWNKSKARKAASGKKNRKENKINSKNKGTQKN